MPSLAVKPASAPGGENDEPKVEFGEGTAVPRRRKMAEGFRGVILRARSQQGVKTKKIDNAHAEDLPLPFCREKEVDGAKVTSFEFIFDIQTESRNGYSRPIAVR